ncbi:MAG: glycosyltransferase family 4 protein [Dehalococcoidia bacterium]|nr:glycosyltransferase family 4 protein [Dehalococcoidia bacterium]
MADWSDWKDRVRLTLFISDLVPGDAVSGDCLEMQTILRKWGFPSEIYVERVGDQLRDRVKLFNEYREVDNELIIFHYSTWSQMADYLRSRPDRNLVMKYHNITPPEFFRGANPLAMELTGKGREALSSFAPVTLLGLGDSEFNRLELAAAGFQITGVLPITIDFAGLDGEPNREVLRIFKDDWVNLLFVGRVAPNKRHEDVAKAFYYYRRLNPRSRLFFVGAQDISHTYRSWLAGVLERMGISGDVHFTGHTSHAELLSYYHLADVFICMSDHEGFCVPLVESMHLGVPVLAYGSTAVPYTLGDGGIVLHRKDFRATAEVVHLLVTDHTLRSRLIARGRRRALDFSRENVEKQFAGYLVQALENWKKLQ